MSQTSAARRKSPTSLEEEGQSCTDQLGVDSPDENLVITPLVETLPRPYRIDVEIDIIEGRTAPRPQVRLVAQIEHYRIFEALAPAFVVSQTRNAGTSKLREPDLHGAQPRSTA
jgi:hypothetical protein